MANLNKVFLIGNLTRDPELRYTPSGTAVADFGMAMNRRWNRPGGETREETCFVDCQAWARSAEVISEYCSKGRPIFIEGRLQLDQWEGRDGQKRSKLRVVVENFQFLGSRGDRSGNDRAPQRGGTSPQRSSPKPAPEQQQDAPQSDDSGDPSYQVDDDIPF